MIAMGFLFACVVLQKRNSDQRDEEQAQKIEWVDFLINYINERENGTSKRRKEGREKTFFIIGTP